jgi:hypothetical protein
MLVNHTHETAHLGYHGLSQRGALQPKSKVRKTLDTTPGVLLPPIPMIC